MKAASHKWNDKHTLPPHQIKNGMFMQSIHEMAARNGNDECSPTRTYGVRAEVGLLSVTSRTKLRIVPLLYGSSF